MDLMYEYFRELAEETIREEKKKKEYNKEGAIQKLRKQQEQLTDQYNFEFSVLEQQIINITLGEE